MLFYFKYSTIEILLNVKSLKECVKKNVWDLILCYFAVYLSRRSEEDKGKRTQLMAEETEKQIILLPTQPFNVTILYSSYRWIENWTWSAMLHNYWRLYWNREEGAYIETDGKKLLLTKDKVVLVPPNTGYPCRSRNPFHHFYIHFTAPPPYDHVKPQIYTFSSDVVMQYIDRLTDEKYSMIHYQMLQSIINIYLLRLPESAFLDPEDTGMDKRIEYAVKRLSELPWKKISNSEICRKTGLTLNEFYFLFKKEMGTTPRQYVIAIRMENAKRLLLNTELNIDEVAEYTGYADRYQFSKAFRQFYNDTPAAFRKNNS